MPIPLTVNGVTYQYPQRRNVNWGIAATGWASAVTAVLESFRSPSLPTADSGQIRLGNTDSLAWRDFGDTQNIKLFVDTDDILYYQKGSDPVINIIAAAAGNVTGPVVATDNAIARYNGTSGQTIQNSGVIIGDTNNVSGIVNLAMTGVLSGVTAITTTDLTVTNDTDLVDLDASGAIVFSGTSGHNVSEEFADQVIEKYARPTGTTVGVRGVAISPSSGTFSTTLNGFQEITNLTVNITTTGRPVVVQLIGDWDGVTPSLLQIFGTADNTNNRQMGFTLAFVRDNVIVNDLFTLHTAQAVNGELMAHGAPPSAFQFVDVVGAGTYGYKVQIRKALSGTYSGSTTLQVFNIKLVAYEL